MSVHLLTCILSGSPDHVKAKRENKDRLETVLSCCSAVCVFSTTWNNNSADQTTAIRGPCFTFWCLGKRLDNHHLCSSSVGWLMYSLIISCNGVGALYFQYYVNDRQRCCCYYKNKYSFEPVLTYEVVSWSVLKGLSPTTVTK